MSNAPSRTPHPDDCGHDHPTEEAALACEAADGDCFPVAFRLVLADPRKTLCHGTVVRATDGLAHPHAWVELTETYDVPVHGEERTVRVDLTTAIDKANGHDVELPASVYRKVGQAHDVVEYTHAEAYALAVRWDHYGPWSS